MPKRTTQDRRKAEQQPEKSTGAQRDSFTITTLPINEGDDESDESYYSGLESEPDTSNSSNNGDDDIVVEQDSDIEEESIHSDDHLSDDIGNASDQGLHDPVNIYAESDTSDEESEDKSAISKAQASQRNQVIHDKIPGNQTRQNYHKFHMSHDEWQRLEKQTMARYRQSLVHKARPMPDYKFFVPKRNLKPLTTPISPNLPGKKIRNNYSANS